MFAFVVLDSVSSDWLGRTSLK